MKSLEEIRNTQTYQNADDTGKALIEQEYNKRYGTQGEADISNNDRIAGQAKNLAQDVQNVTNPNYENLKDIPEALPNTQNIKPNAVPIDTPSKSWDQITNTQTYKNASDEDKYAIRQEYEKRGGTAEESNPGILRSAKTASQGAFFSVRDAATNMVYGTGILASDILNKSDEVLNTITGQGPNNSMLGNWTKQSSQYLQKSLNDLNRGAAVQANATGVSTTEAGETATKYAAPIAQGAALLTSGGSAAIPLAISAAGSHYGNTEEDKKSISTSLTVGGIQQLANELLPGSGGKIASTVEQGATKFFSDVASPTVNKLLSNTLGTVTRAGEATGLGYAGGYGVGAGTALAEGKSLKEANEQGLESAKEGAAMGLGFHVAGEGIRYATKPKVSEASPLTFRNKVDNQTEEIDKTQNATGAERQQAFSNANERNAAAAHNIVEEAGLKSTQQTIKAGGLGEAGNVSEKAGDKAFADLEGVKQNYNNTVNTFNESTKASNTRNLEDVINAIKPHVGDEAKTVENKTANEAVSKWQNLAKKRMTEQAKANVNYENLTELAQREHDAFLNMQAHAPDAAEFVKSNWDNPFSNNTKGYDPIAHANEHIAADKYLDAVGTKLRSASDITDPSALSKALKWAIPSAAHIGLWSHGGGVAEHALLGAGEAGLGAAINYGKNRINARKTAKGRTSQLQQGAQTSQAINKAQTIVKTAHESPVTPVSEEGYREARRTREQASIEAQRQAQAKTKAEEKRQLFAGHEDLQKQITPENYADKQHISNLRAQLVERTTAAKAQAKQAEREAATKQAQKENADAVKQYKDANPHLSEFIAEAQRNLGKDISVEKLAKETDRLAYGKKAMSTTGEKNKTPFKAGSKEEFYEEVNRNRFIDDAQKSNQRSLVDLYFKQGGGKLSSEGQKNLHRAIAADNYKIINPHNEQVANEAKSRGEALAKRVDTRDAIARSNYQRETVENSLNEAFKDSGLSERSTNKFIKSKMQELSGKKFDTQAEFNDHLKSVKAEAAELIKSKTEDNQPKAKPKSSTEESTTSTNDEFSKLSDVESNNIRDKYIDKIADTIGKDSFNKHMDELESFIDEHGLTDTATSVRLHRWLEVVSKIHERKQAGIIDPHALISHSEYAAGTKNGTELGVYLRHALGVSEDFKALPDAKFKTYEADKAKAETEVKKKANREKRAISKARLTAKTKR
ncbi:MULTISPECIES: hypothetical protein [Enterobacter cloacae complex]|uniref:hypothetical protein n=2 Tax=Enterobacter TaxID=547 RepID=UPI0010125387|nr:MULTISPECIES: hypothetical protein [Enterobacter cloacae complex]MDQ6584448.1 hypothetical protein [Enterobacter hormaechei]